MVYESPGPVSRNRFHERIFAPISYPLVRCLRVVPVVWVEALTLAAWFPVVWQESDQATDLVVVRSLLDDGLGHQPAAMRSPDSLPLVLRAYPFLLDPKQEGASVTAVLYDGAVADQPTDAGAPIADSTGRLSRGSQVKINSLRLFAQDLASTQEISRALKAAGLLEPWPLSCSEGNAEAKIDNLQVLAPKAYEDRQLCGLFQQFGWPALNLVGSHRLSLYRAGVVVGSARKVLRQTSRNTTPQAS